MGQKDERDRMKQSQIERRKGKPSAARATRSSSRKASDHSADQHPTKAFSLDALIHEMRTRARRHYSLQSYPTAAFFAEKAVAASSSSDDDVIFLARIHHASGAHARALTALTSRRLERSHASARLLAGQCLLSTGAVLECLDLIGEEEDPAHEPAISSTGRAASERARAVEHAASPDVRALLCVLRARAYETLENAPRVSLWYRRALAADPACAEAFLALTQSGLLTAGDSAALAKSLSAPARPTAPPPSAPVAALFRVTADPSVPIFTLPSPLRHSTDVLAATARRKLASLDFPSAASICQSLLARDPHASSSVVSILLAALVETGSRQELFRVAHALVESRPKSGVAWLAVGYYYLASGVADTARRYLQKATVLSPRLAAAWTAMGHAYAAQDESDHALSAYSTAARLYPGAHFPRLCMGIQHARQSSLGPACTLFLGAAEADPRDPAPLHELGVISFRMGDLSRAAEYFRDAIALWKVSETPSRGDEETETEGDGLVGPTADPSGKRAESQEISLVNLGHCYRRLREFKAAKQCYEEALSLRPGGGATFVALGLTLHSMQRFGEAIAMYHRALRYAPEDVICNELLERAMADNVEFGELDAGDEDQMQVLDADLYQQENLVHV